MKQIHTMDSYNGLYLVKAYLRARINKIRKNWVFLMSMPDKERVMAAHELDFLTDLFNLRVSGLHEQFFKGLPKQLNPFLSTKKFEKIAKEGAPDFKKKVLVEVLDSTPLPEGVNQLSMYDLVKFREKGDVLYSRYELVRPLIAHKKVVLL